MYYWVNQGQTYQEEKSGGYLWAPLKNIKGKSVFHWETMANLQINDVVFNYCGVLRGYCIVKSLPYLTPRPAEFNWGVNWENEGRMCDVEYYDFEQNLTLNDIPQDILRLFPSVYSPLISTGLRANQGYLYAIDDECGSRILELANVHSVNYFDITEGNHDGLIILNDLPNITSRRGLVTSRVGQGLYRRRLLQRWEGKCAVSNCSITEILIASHIKPWCDSDDFERLDVNNGILLSPKYDALFDRHLISFQDTGEIIISAKLTQQVLGDLKMSGNEKIKNITEGNKKYLADHRNKLK